jgi:prefoldin subunit 5
MRTLKLTALCVLLAAAASPFLVPVQAQTPSVADIKATAEAIQTLTDQQKTINDNQTKIDEKLADITENIRVARLYAARAK